jgi:anti-anti-sigma factor
VEIIETNTGGVFVVEPHGRMDSTTATLFGEHVIRLIRSGSHRLVIDLGQVLYISSAGFRSLLIARKLVDEFKGKLVLCGMSAEIRRLFEIGNFMNLFQIYASREEALGQAA